MVVGHFLKWIDTARVAERAAAAGALARAYVLKELPFDERCAAEAALTLLLDDPSWKVRQAMAEALSMSRHAPLQVISALAGDQPEVAGLVLARSPLLTDTDLVDRVAAGQQAVQVLIARRPALSMLVSAAIAETGEPEACIALLANSGAEIASLSFRRMAERHGDIALVREALIGDPRLPSDCRHTLLVKVGEALARSPLVAALIGRNRVERVTRDACIKASLTLIEATNAEEHVALVEHLRLRGDLTTGFLVRTVAHGKVDFFGAALVVLTGQAATRVRALLAGGQDVALVALFGKAGLAVATHKVLLRALKVWREVANGKRMAGVQEVSWLMLKELGGASAPGDLAGLVKAIHLDALRENARGHALAIASEAA
ncbi:DUF2336 domain-containing protein [Pseudaminobacter arsenicus]|uniref:DUF2336 domain-containing protein n=1 Tax=Borborobacter arsenicus TaxID=1851146 RepID=A0A432VBI0_9HYPH|nr:DUF2336 domain-containing protein [Pseudaminobacter arsenicus]RUM99453.1 DUF2336 domain-containing protein [Pseudaminobacter arsenicus]